jgi:hypothetical protein
MTDLSFWQNQVVRLGKLVDLAADDVFMRPVLETRLELAKKNLEDATRQKDSLLPKAHTELPRAAMFISGRSVSESGGIPATLAGRALIDYEAMFVEQALHDERADAKTRGGQRRPKGAVRPTLLFTGTPRGSFGLEFVPQPAPDETNLPVHAATLGNVADSIIRVVENATNGLDDALQATPRGVIRPLQSLLKVLSTGGADLRLAFPDKPSKSLSADAIMLASQRLEKHVHVAETDVHGILRGITYESGHFDLKADSGITITGYVDEGLGEENLNQISSLTNTPCVAKLEVTTVTKITSEKSVRYVLLSAKKMGEA